MTAGSDGERVGAHRDLTSSVVPPSFKFELHNVLFHRKNNLEEQGQEQSCGRQLKGSSSQGGRLHTEGHDISDEARHRMDYRNEAPSDARAGCIIVRGWVY